MLINAAGRLDPETETYIPEMDRQRAITISRVWMLIYAAILAAYRELFPILWRQRTEPDIYLRRALPDTAQPYREPAL
mgnify:FL=1